jgi:hypothetical protein
MVKDAHGFSVTMGLSEVEEFLPASFGKQSGSLSTGAVRLQSIRERSNVKKILSCSINRELFTGIGKYI